MSTLYPAFADKTGESFEASTPCLYFPALTSSPLHTPTGHWLVTGPGSPLAPKLGAGTQVQAPFHSCPGQVCVRSGLTAWEVPGWLTPPLQISGTGSLPVVSRLGGPSNSNVTENPCCGAGRGQEVGGGDGGCFCAYRKAS